MTHKTKGIVLRTVKYGETSVVATIYTQKFGTQTYMVNGVRSGTKKNGAQAMMQPSSLLDMEVYHSELKGMQRIKEFSRSEIFMQLTGNVIRNSIALFVVEMMLKTLQQPEQNEDLFHFCEDCLVFLDKCEMTHTAAFPLFFLLQLPQFLGFSIHNPDSSLKPDQPLYLDLKEGLFVSHQPAHDYFLDQMLTHHTIELLKVIHPSALTEIKLDHNERRKLLQAYLQYYSLHISDFGTMKTVKVLQEVL